MFHRCNNEEDLKKTFRKLAHHLHPDKGGESELMILLTECYDQAMEVMKIYSSSKIRNEKEDNLEFEEFYEDIKKGDKKLKIIDDILKYAKKHEKFDSSFTLSIKSYLKEKGYITSFQYNALVNVYYSFHMHKDGEEVQKYEKQEKSKTKRKSNKNPSAESEDAFSQFVP